MPSIAARVAGWQRRLGGQAGPLGPVSAGSGESPNGQFLQVELLLGGTWVDITSYVMVRDGSGSVDISRGQPNESANTDPARATFQLNNRDGRFTPRNPAGPYYGLIGRNTPLRISVPSGNDKSYRFQGEVAQWPQHWDTTGTDVWVELEASGILRRLGQGTSPVSSALKLSLTSDADNHPPVVYWPCEDRQGATSVASAVAGVGPMAVAGSPTFGSSTAFVCSEAIPMMRDASFTGTVPAYTVTDVTSVQWLMAVPQTGLADGQSLMWVRTNGTVPIWEAYYDAADGFMRMRGMTEAGVVLYSGFGGTPVQGLLVNCSIELINYGTDYDASVWAQEVGSIGRGGATVTVPSTNIGQVISIVAGFDRGLGDTAIGHIRLLTTADFYDIYYVLNAYAGEHAGERVERLCGIAGVPFESGGDLTIRSWMGAQTASGVRSLIDECAEVDGGILYEQTSAVGLGFRPRPTLENQSPAVTLSYTGNQLAEIPTPVDDDQYTRNDITTSRSGGSSARVVQADGPMSILTPPAGAGRYDTAVTVNVQLDSDLLDQAGWRVHLGTVDEPRYPVIAVNLAHPSITPSLRTQLLAVKQGDRIAVTGLPSWLPPGDLSQLVLGFKERITQFEHRISFTCAPESPYRVGVLEDAVLSRLDTAGSQIAVEAGPAATSLQVSTISGPVWTTTDVPFDVMIAGEQVTVTAVTGASSPQTFTVTRSVNGVTKTQPVGADVRLYQPTILAL
ncbi:hypothetical protein [Kitasatospora sp. A2-31]|uniref:hypothetical protein n=1 Tax=Kitasatospora sp. A2-31 TaxID=2916414 RepID=UPI001EE8AAE6|nr:hypothetical protein [Kitasatospora sp. A2-31]MCG6493446.1 hypothetical protein [Kitasatospora sp. A2-31]